MSEIPCSLCDGIGEVYDEETDSWLICECVFIQTCLVLYEQPQLRQFIRERICKNG